MTTLMDQIVGGGSGADKNPKFPHAPAGWTQEAAIEAAAEEGLELGDEHWDTLRELHDALDEKFHAAGGIKHVYRLFPGGPVAQGCRVAGLKAPAGATDRGFGSVA